MVTKGYRKGVYEWVTKGITGSVTSAGCAGSQTSELPVIRAESLPDYPRVARHAHAIRSGEVF